MGMPLQTEQYYRLMQMAGKGDRQSWAPELEKALRPFTIFVFIIYHPQTHRRLANYLNREFDVLDSCTNDGLLFFAPVEPSQMWRDIAQNRNYYDLMTLLERHTPESYSQDQQQNIDPDIAFHALCHSLKIPKYLLPCLVITTDITKKRPLIYKTSADTIQQQLSYLGMIAKRNPDMRYDWRKTLRIFAQERSMLELCRYSTARNLELSLANTFLEVFSCMLANSQITDARDQARQALSRIQQKLNSLRPFNWSDEEDSAVFERLCVKISDFLALTAGQTAHSGWIGIDPAFLEPESRVMLKTSKCVHDYFTADIGDKADIISSDAVDNTPWVICLTKLFEMELSLSVSHWFRKILGIEMPKYFNRKQPNKTAKYPLAYPVDFNKEKRGEWIPPMLNQVYSCLEHKKPKDILGILRETEISCLMSNLKFIADIRNRSAHTKLLGRDPGDQVVGALKQLADNQIFEKLYQLKSRFSGKRKTLW